VASLRELLNRWAVFGVETLMTETAQKSAIASMADKDGVTAPNGPPNLEKLSVNTRGFPSRGAMIGNAPGELGKSAAAAPKRVKGKLGRVSSDASVNITGHGALDVLLSNNKCASSPPGKSPM
jgi:hypothetical protein